MKGKKLMLALAVATLMALPLVSAFAAGPGDPDTTVQVTDTAFDCGETGASQILVSIANDPTDPQPLHGVEVHLSFDPAKLQVVDIAAEGGLFPSDEQTVVQEFDNAAGTILFAVSRLDGASVQDTANAAIATITWEAAFDCANLPEGGECHNVNVADALMSDADGYAITVDTKLPGQVCINGFGCIEGLVNLQGRYDFSLVTVSAEKDGVLVASTTTDAGGYFTLTVPQDTYEVYAEMYGYLVSLHSDVVVEAGEVCTDLGATKLLGGEVVPDAVIDIGDIAYIAYRFRGDDMTADVNADSVVNIQDLTMAAANFGQTGPTSWSMTP